MKRNLIIFSSIAFLTLALPSFAELTVDDASSIDYLKNHQHSNSAIYATQKSKAMANGEKYNIEPEETFDEYYEKPVIKQVRRLLMYLDPALDDHSFLNEHQINTTTKYNDW